jgi:alkanesulfonate monooxygenase SsuD/methylene tetrahydromethanopterin reductase-like flavin-dependent oxidoreductase (luciferase family)
MVAPKVIVQLYPMIPAADEEDRKRRRPLGRNRDAYHRALHDWIDIIKAAEEMGVWGASTIEHHLHSEGYEVGPNPGILNAWWAAQFKKIRIGALGYVMATQDPIRVAEETAILDHITRGRYFVGFARGYQSRWTNTLGQFTETRATLSDGSNDDERNRRIFEERIDMVLQCWTEDSVQLKGDYYQAPFPLDSGIVGYPARKIASEAGGIGEVDAAGALRRFSVVPAPYQSPHPPIFVAVSRSEPSVRYCARNGFRVVHFSKGDGIAKYGKIYQEEAAKHGRKYQFGERQCSVRWPHIASSQEEYDRKLVKYDLDIYKNFYSPFFPQLPADVNWVQNMKDSGLFLGGTLEQARTQFQQEWAKCPCEYLTLIWHYAQQPKDEVIWELEQFMRYIWQTLDAVEPSEVSDEAAA